MHHDKTHAHSPKQPHTPHSNHPLLLTQSSLLSYLSLVCIKNKLNGVLINMYQGFTLSESLFVGGFKVRGQSNAQASLSGNCCTKVSIHLIL